MKTIKILIVLLLISRIGWCEVPDWFEDGYIVEADNPMVINGWEPPRYEFDKLVEWMHSVEERLEKLESSDRTQWKIYMDGAESVINLLKGENK